MSNFLLLLYCLAELSAAFVDLHLGIGIDTAIVLATLLAILFRPNSDDVAVFVGIALIALQRLFSVTLPSDRMQVFTWYAVVGTPILVGLLLAHHTYFEGWLPREIRGKSTLVANLSIGLLGVPMALVTYAAYRPQLLGSAITTLGLLLDIASVTLFAGMLQEFLFRGFLQRAASRKQGKLSILSVSLVFAASTSGTYSLPFSLAAFGMSLVYGYIYERYQALAGLLLAHGLFAFLYFVAFPIVIR